MITNITSKRHLIKFYLAIIGFVFFFLIMALMVGVLHEEALSKIGEVIMVVISALLVFMAFYTVVRYYKNAPTIEVDDTSITFNHSEKYFWKDVETIELTGKKPFKFIFGDTMEAATLKFAGQQERSFFDDMYSNSHEIKSFIQQVVVDKKPHVNPEDFYVDKPNVTDESFVYFNGYQLLCFEGISFWVLFLPSLFFFVRSWLIFSATGIVLSLIFAFVSSVLLRRMYYFGVSNNHFVVKLNNIFWFKKIYRLSDIKEVVYELHFRNPAVYVRIITTDFKSKLYPAGTIWSKKLIQMKDELEKKGIKVRNEGVSYTPFEFKLFN